MLLTQNDNGDHGFSVSVAGEHEKTAFVETRSRESAIQIFSSLSRSPHLIRLGQAIFDPESVLQAYYNSKDMSLNLLMVHGAEKFEDVPIRDGLSVLSALCGKFGFTPAQAVNVSSALSRSTVSGVVEAINPRRIAAIETSSHGDTTQLPACPRATSRHG